MAFIPEDGTGYNNSNSLATVEFADSHHSERGNAAWAAIQLERKRELLITATDYVVDIYGLAFDGVPIFTNQALPFPRYVTRASTLVNVGNPLGVRKAIAELALIANTTPLLTNISRTKKRVKVGPLEVEYDGNSATQTQFVSASLKLAPWLKSSLAGGRTARLVRT